jgi:pyroglutamyl-peptidase
MQKTLITGFAPFDGREINASWVAASAIDRESVSTLEIPVVWGEPLKILSKYCSGHCPETIVSLGEGRNGWFDIETVALNTRMERPDNVGHSPKGEPINIGGPAAMIATINAMAIQRNLAGKGYPIRISKNAGQFLCEETLYVLEQLKQAHETLTKVIFCHVPPFGTTIHIKGKAGICNAVTLKQFANNLLDEVAF